MNSTDKLNSKPGISSEKYYIFLVGYLVGISAFGSFVNDMFTPTLPEMTHFFHCSVSTIQLGLTMGMLGLGLGQIILGPVSDKYGRKPVLLTTLLIFIAGAVISVFSPTVGFFLGCRLVQGLGASGGYFLARTIPADIYQGRPLAKMMALIGAINGLAPASAPVIGGFLAESIGWKGIFWTLAGYAVLLLLLAFALHESLPTSQRFRGKLLEAFGEYKILVKRKKFMIHVMLKGSALGLLFAYISAAPFIIQTHFGYSPMIYGVVMGVNAAFVAFGAKMATRFGILKDAAWLAGLILTAATFVEVFVLFFLNDFWAFEIALLPMSFSMGMIFTVGNTLAMNEGRDHAGAASALLGLVGYIFGAIVSPLAGMGNIMHSMGIIIGIMTIITLVLSWFTRKASPDTNM